ncbi:hypothetical protein DER45DRAFT_557035 [Fusarium avenaceum]|nr:hypothetical protein DER45DRAFT_557035 [Fusarium avenaceum]
MADVLGVTASIAGIISLADTAYHYVFRYTRGVLGAKDDVRHLAQELNSLSSVLRSLHALAAVLETENQLYDPTLKVKHLADCQETIEEVRKRVKKAADDFDNSARWQGFSRQLKWPFSMTETRDLLSKVARYKDTISLAASADTMRQLQISLSLQSKHQQETIRLLSDTHKKVEITTAISLNAKKQSILDFFMGPDLNPQSSLKQYISLHQPTTGNWLLESEEVKGWFDNPGSQLWLNGIAGGGKTILASVVIQEVLSRNMPDCGKAFFFCDYKKENTLSPVNILGTIVTQLALQKDECFICLENYYTDLHPERNLSSEPDVDELRAQITRMASNFSQVLIVIDGIDECQEEVRSQLLASLVELADGSDNIGMAIFSRAEMDIRARLETDFEDIKIEAHTEDIATYVRAEMERRRISGQLMINTMLIKDEIEHELITRAHGMFRWVSCQLDYLSEFVTDVDRRYALNELPPTLQSSYQRILQKINKHPLRIRKMVQLCLQFIAFSPRRLTINELCDAVSAPETLGEHLNSTNTVLEKSIAWSCSSLIRKSADGEYFELAHFTVLEFLQSRTVSELAFFMPVPSESRFLMGLQCLRFLQLADFNSPVSEAPELLLKAIEIGEHRTFYIFAAQYWTTLISDQLHNHLAYEAATRFFQRPCSPCFRLWIVTIATMVRFEPTKAKELDSMNRDKEDWFAANLASASSLDPIHFASALNLAELCPKLLGNGCDVNSLCNDLTSLSASEVSLFGLFEPDIEFLRPSSTIFSLVLPSSTRRKATAKYLVEAGATRSASTGIYFANIMLFAWHLQDFSTVIDFISKGGTPTDTDLESLTIYFHKLCRPSLPVSKQLETALFILNKFLYDTALLETTWGFKFGTLLWSTAVSMGMSFTSDPALTDTKISLSLDGLRTQMDMAVKNDNAEELRKFLQDGRVGIRDFWTSDSGGPTTLLQDAAWQNAGRCFDLLLDLGSDPYVLSDDGNNAISLIDTKGDGNLLHTAVRYGVDMLKPNTAGANLWHMVALKPSNPQFFDALIETNPEGSWKAMSNMASFGMTPLCIALRSSDANNDYEYDQPFEAREAKALRFIEYCNTVPQFWVKHDSILNMAFDFGSIQIIEKLIDIGVCPTTPTICNPSPLHHIYFKASPSWVCFLKTMFPGAIGQRYKDRLPLEIYLGNVIENKTSLNQTIATMLSSCEILSSKDQYNIMPWQYVCELPDGFINRNQLNDCKQFNSVWELLISLRAMEFFEQNTGQCGLDVWIPRLCSLAKYMHCPVSDITSVSTLDVAIESSLYWNPSSEHVIRLLRQALGIQSKDIIETLLKHGADVHQPLRGVTTIAFACAIWQVLLQFVERGKPIYLALFEHSQTSKLNDFCLHMNLLHWTSFEATDVHEQDGLRWLVTQLVSRGVDIEGIDEDAPVDLRIPPLLHHVSKGSFAVAGILLDMGANVNPTVSHSRRAVVHECIRRGNVSFLQKLVGLHRQKKQEIDWERLSSYRVKLPGSFNPIEMTPLHVACSKGQHECLRLLLNEVNVSLEKEAPRGLTALHFAAISGNTAIINELVGLGHSVTVFSDTGDTPLHLAANNGHLFAVKSLIDLGALDTANVSYSTARTLAATNGYNEIVEMLEEAWGSTFYDNVADKITARKTRILLTKLRASIYNGNIRGCQRSDRGGCPLDRGLPLEDGYTPLMLALCENQQHIATWLLDHGVSVFRRSYSASQAGFTSAIVIASGHTDFVQLLPTLLDHYVNQTPDWITDYWVAIWEAISKVNSQGLEVLFSFLKAELDTSMCPRDRDKVISGVINKIDGALHCAVGTNDLEIVKLLLQYGVDIDRLDSSGSSVLVEAKTKDMVALLLSFGISLGPLVSESAYDLVALWLNASPNIIDLLSTAILNEGLHRALQVLEWSADAMLPMGSMQNAISGPLIGITHLGYASEKDLLQQNYVHMVFDRRGTQYLHSSGFFLEDPQPFPWYLITAGEVKNLSFLRENIVFVNKLLGSDSSKRWLNLNPTKGWSPLCRAASMDQISAMENCLSLGADIDFEGSPLGSALMIACACGQHSAVKLLVRKGANLGYHGKHGWISVMELTRSKAVRKWLLVGRFNDQMRLQGGSDVPTTGMQAQTGRWRGPIQVRVNLNGFEEIQEGESTLGYAKRLTAYRRSMYGRVPDYIESLV